MRTTQEKLELLKQKLDLEKEILSWPEIKRSYTFPPSDFDVQNEYERKKEKILEFAGLLPKKP